MFPHQPALATTQSKVNKSVLKIDKDFLTWRLGRTYPVSSGMPMLAFLDACGCAPR
jgi:hypothetical protein